MDDFRPKRSLADDPTFLASLEGLDEGLVAEDEPATSPAPPRASVQRPQPPPPRAAAPPPAAPPPRAPVAPPLQRAAIAQPVAPAPPDRRVPPPAQPAPSAAPPRRRSVLELFPPSPTPASAPPPAPIVEREPPMPPRPPARAAEPPVRTVEQLARAAQPARRPVAPMPVEPPAPPKSYLTFYSLDEEPFALTPDPRFFYRSTSHDDAAQELLTAIRRREGVVVVTGRDGVGKTTLCRTVVEQLDRRTLTSFVVNPPETFDGLVRTGLIDFGVISADDLQRAQPETPDLLVALREFLVSLAPLQAFGVLFVDEAQRIPNRVLRDVRRLAETGGDERLLQIVLVGNERLERKLKRGDMKPLVRDVTVRCHVEPLGLDEIAGYVMHRVAIAGTNPRVDFSDEAFARLHELSAGVPRIINQLCDRSLEIGAASAASVIEVPTVDEAADALGVEPPESTMHWAVRMALLMLLLALLMVAGAGVAAYVFHDRVAAAITHWERIPPAPRRPALPKTLPLGPVTGTGLRQ